jgi:hypothetical protein
MFTKQPDQRWRNEEKQKDSRVLYHRWRDEKVQFIHLISISCRHIGVVEVKVPYRPYHCMKANGWFHAVATLPMRKDTLVPIVKVAEWALDLGWTQ